MTAQLQSETKHTAISGWFRITIVSIAASTLFAAYLDDEGFLDRFFQYFVWVVLAIAAIRATFYAANWIACGFSHLQARKLVRHGKFLIGIFACAVFLYLTLPLYRYSVIAIPGSDFSGGPAHFVLLDKISGEVLWLGRVDDRKPPRRQPV